MQTVLNSGAKIDNKYDAIARLTSKTLNTGAANYVTNYSYLAGVNGSSTTKLGSIDNNGSKINYTYDKNGNIETLTTGDKVIKYYYNELNELIREDNGVLNKTITYSYDAGGNITSKTEYAYTTVALGNKANTINYGYGDANWKDKLTSYNGQNITYDAIGNPLSFNGWALSWQNGRQLASMIGNGNSIFYKYNDAGIRTQKIVNGVTTNYHLSGDKVSYETNGVDNIYYSYDASGKLTSMNLNGTEYYYIRNAQGDVIGLIDKSGDQVVSYAYDSWGKLVSIDGSLKDSVGVKNPYRYRGYRYDSETGIYYLQSRYYNPEWGRFINADVIAAVTGELLSANMFAYCANNSITMKDPSGFRHLRADFEETDYAEPPPEPEQTLGDKVTSSPISSGTVAGGDAAAGNVISNCKGNKSLSKTVTNAVRGVKDFFVCDGNRRTYRNLQYALEKGRTGKVGWWQGKVGFLGTALFGLTLCEDWHNNQGCRNILMAMGIDTLGFGLGIAAGLAVGALGAPVLVSGALVVGAGVGISYLTSWMKEKKNVN